MHDDNVYTEETLFLDVILPVPIPQAFTYRVPRDLNELVVVGARVIVSFGKNRVMTGLISSIHNKAPQNYKAKYIDEILDESPIISSHQLWLFQWMADYYLCNVGEVMNIALPSGLKVSSQSRIQINPTFDSPELLSAEEVEFLNTLEKNDSLSYDELKKFLGDIDIAKFVKSLISKHAVILYDAVKEKYSPKKLKKVRLKRVYEGQEEILNLIESLEKSSKQQEVIMTYVQLIPFHELHEKNQVGITKKDLLDLGVSPSSYKTLIEKGILEEYELTVSRFGEIRKDELQGIHLSDVQERVSNELLEKLGETNTVLLHGVTGSGKTEIYIDLIKKALDNGVQVLMLLPEIALTTQIVNRLRKVFGDAMGVYHSKFSDNERVEVWKGVLEDRYSFVVGVRSAVFLPFENLGLIIIDEEHESSYKQYDPAPRYHARDTAIMLAHKVGAKVILGSATPSIESYYQAKEGKYGLVNLSERFGDAQLPKVELANIREEKARQKIKSDFGSTLQAAISQNIEKHEQTIIFQNRRGYAPYLNCEECNWIGSCHQCSVSLTYHYKEHLLICHYCGHKEKTPHLCPTCGSGKIKSVGIGTEKIEDDLNVLYPEAKIIRMDLDTTRSKNAYQQIIGEVESGGVDILVGTQMVSKGLDFDKVSLVGVFDADRMIYFPDFRSGERAFQMLTQVSGRAGRKEKPGRVIIQTNSPTHPLLKMVIDNDYHGFYDKEIIERERYNYPPFSRLIRVTTKHVDKTLSHAAAGTLAQRLASKLSKERILGPEKALVERVRNQYIFEVWIKLEKNKLNIAATKAFIREQITEMSADKKYKSVRFVPDVDVV
ncbi:replication restart DNA helicase PriA [Spirosomataceae bacterium TFI 002]|nr:replication restart DNA helicase PriA [Spirosomataceae bacterium TFI 002]